MCADDREPSRLGRAPPRTRPARPAPRRAAPPRPAPRRRSPRPAEARAGDVARRLGELQERRAAAAQDAQAEQQLAQLGPEAVQRAGARAAAQPQPPAAHLPSAERAAARAQVGTLKEKKLHHVHFVGNPFVEEVEAYRIWIISNCPKLHTLDGDKVTAAEKRSRIKEAPAVLREKAADGEAKEEAYYGKKVTVKLFELSARLMACFDAPDRTLDAVEAVQELLLKLVPIDPRGRIMFDFEQEDTRDELELMEAQEQEEETEEVATDYREPAELIEELMQTLLLLVERQPAAAAKTLRLIVLCLSIENEGLADRALAQLLDFLEAGGGVAELVVDTLMSTLLPQLTDAKIPERSRDLLLKALHALADDGEAVKEAMRPLAPTLTAWIGVSEPSEAVLGVIAAACKDVKMALELREERLPKRVISLMQSREVRRRAPRRDAMRRAPHRASQPAPPPPRPRRAAGRARGASSSSASASGRRATTSARPRTTQRPTCTPS